MGLLCFARTGQKVFDREYLKLRSPFSELAWMLDRSDNLESALLKLYTDLNVPVRLRDLGIPEKDLVEIAFKTTKDVGNITSNPVRLSEQQILEVLKEFY